jgi:hypothetical protein
MDATNFRRIALSLEGTEEKSHMGAPDFRVSGRIFATLAAERQGYGNLILTPELQAAFVAERPELFVPVAGGWGRTGATHIRLAAADQEALEGALRAAWKLRIEKNETARNKARDSAKQRNCARAKDRGSLEEAKQRKAELRARLTTPESLESVKRRYGLND